MIFKINKIESSLDKIYEVPLVFLENAQNTRECNRNLCPTWFRRVYTRCPGVKARFEDLFKFFKKLSKAKQRSFIDLYRKSRNIENICNDPLNIYPAYDKIDTRIINSIKNLFEFLYNETIDTDIFKHCTGMHIRDHYSQFMKKNIVHVCPFCGLETYTLPEFRRAEYDHYLPFSLYPWLSVNFNNLVPMGDHCNGKKNNANILYSNYATSTRRLVWYPYNWYAYSINVKCNAKPDINNPNGTWEVNLASELPAHTDYIKTWNDVFEIELRYTGEMQRFHKKYIDDFKSKNEIMGMRLTVNQLKEQLIRYRDTKVGDPTIETMSKLKYAWAEYFINCVDKSQLALIIQEVSVVKKLPKL